MKMLQLDHYKQSTDYTCGPATLLSFLEYHDKEFIRDLSEKRLTSILQTCPIIGTPPRNLYNFLKEKSNKFTLIKNSRLADLRKSIDNGKPSIVLWYAHNDWHWSTVIGYNKNNIILLDPYIDDGINMVENEKFNQTWCKLAIS